MSNSLQCHELQHARLPCPSPTPRVHPNPCPLSRWCHPTSSSSVVPFSSCPQSFPASGSFQMSQLFTSGGQSIGVSASASVFPVNTQDWIIKICSYIFMSFIVLDLTFRSMIHFELIFTWFGVGVQLHSFACGYPIVPIPFIEKTILSSTDVLALFLKINAKSYFWILSSISWIYMFNLLPVPQFWLP